jgi:hypothetical protein
MHCSGREWVVLALPDRTAAFPHDLTSTPECVHGFRVVPLQIRGLFLFSSTHFLVLLLLLFLLRLLRFVLGPLVCPATLKSTRKQTHLTGRAIAQAIRFEPRSGHVGFVEDKVRLGQVFTKHFGFSFQFSFHRLLHAHHPGLLQ